MQVIRKCLSASCFLRLVSEISIDANQINMTGPKYKLHASAMESLRGLHLVTLLLSIFSGNRFIYTEQKEI